MKSTDSCKNRPELNGYFNKAKKNPVAITRGVDRFILMNEKEFLNMKDELLSLQKNLISLLQINNGQSESFQSISEGFNSLFGEIDNAVDTK